MQNELTAAEERIEALQKQLLECTSKLQTCEAELANVRDSAHVSECSAQAAHVQHASLQQQLEEQSAITMRFKSQLEVAESALATLRASVASLNDQLLEARTRSSTVDVLYTFMSSSFPSKRVLISF